MVLVSAREDPGIFGVVTFIVFFCDKDAASSARQAGRVTAAAPVLARMEADPVVETFAYTHNICDIFN